MQEYVFQVLDKEYKVVAESANSALEIINNKLASELDLSAYTWFSISDSAWRIGLNESVDTLHD